MKHRKARIASSVVGGGMAALLVALWVRSYSECKSVMSGSHWLTSSYGRVYFDEDFILQGNNAGLWRNHLSGKSTYDCFSLQNAAVLPTGNGRSLPYWFSFVVCLFVFGLPGCRGGRVAFPSALS
jgi:hypothetical protein